MGNRASTADRGPVAIFEALWTVFYTRYPFFAIRNVDWRKQYETYRPLVGPGTSEQELFEILCRMLAPLADGHVELWAGTGADDRKRYFNPEAKPRFWQEFSKPQIAKLFETAGATLVAEGFGHPAETAAWMLRYCRSSRYGYLRILELEGIGKQRLTAALDTISADFRQIQGLIIDIRDNPGGDDSVVVAIINRLCDQKRVAFHRQTKIGPGEEDLTPLKTWHIEPYGQDQFTGPIVLLTCDSVFSGGEVFALAIRQLPYVTIIGDHTNGIFSYQLEKKLPNGWRYCLSYQKYLSPDLICYEARGVPPDIRMLNSRDDITRGIDPLIVKALDILKGQSGRTAGA